MSPDLTSYDFILINSSAGKDSQVALDETVRQADALGIPRLSCVFCMYAPEAALVLGGRHNPELLNAYIDVETRTGFTMKPGLSLKVIRERVQAGEAGGASDDVADWCM